jgi:hypothetical protein
VPDIGIACLLGVLFALSRLGAIFFCFGCHDRRPVRPVDDEREGYNVPN